MSASDAAPLPRLGEVFFDVRGNSRSMRLSWYADTGVAVFSVWQGGRCTSTFRLPIDDLPRMIEILQRGPERRRPRLQAADRRSGYATETELAGADLAGYGGPADDSSPRQYEAGGGYEAGGAAGSQAAGGRYEPPAAGYEPADGYETAAYPPAEREPAIRDGHGGTGRRAAGYPDSRPYADSPSGYGDSLPGYGDLPGTAAAGYGDTGRDYQDLPAGYQDPAGGYEVSPGGYGRTAAGYEDSAGHRGPARRRREPSRPAGPADYPGQAQRQPGGYWQEEQEQQEPRDSWFPFSPGGQDGLGDTQLASYGHDRFVPPYVQAQGEAQPTDNQGIGAAHRRSAGHAAYPADQGGDFADRDWGADRAWPGSGYSGGSDYRPAADPLLRPRHSAGGPGEG